MIKLEMGKVGELGGGPKQETHIVISGEPGLVPMKIKN